MVKTILKLFLVLQLFSFSARAAIRFDGVDDYAHMASTSDFSITNQITVSFWYLRETGGSAGWQGFLTKADFGSGPSQYFDIGMFDSQIYVTWSQVGLQRRNYTPTVPANNWQWRHLCYKVRFTVTGTDRLYSDGVLVAGTIDQGDPNTIAPFTNAAPIAIGRNTHGYFKGQMDEIAIWNDYLSENQIQSLARAGVRNLPLQIAPHNLIVYWPADRALSYIAMSGTNTIEDIGGRNLHLTPVNSPSGRASERLSYP